MIAEIKETKMIATLDQCHALIALLPQTINQTEDWLKVTINKSQQLT